MKKTLLSAAVFLAVGTFATTASAHCGSCGVGGEDATQEECASKCADAADDAACEQECVEKHDAEHEKEKK